VDIVYKLLLVLHFIGWAIVLGGTAVSIKEVRLSPGVLHGVLTALVTGLAMVGLASAEVAGNEPNNTKVAVKLVVALVVTGIVVYAAKAPAKVTRALLATIMALTTANIAIAVLWS
jgi:hypothetical protein